MTHRLLGQCYVTSLHIIYSAIKEDIKYEKTTTSRFEPQVLFCLYFSFTNTNRTINNNAKICSLLRYLKASELCVGSSRSTSCDCYVFFGYFHSKYLHLDVNTSYSFIHIQVPCKLCSSYMCCCYFPCQWSKLKWQKKARKKFGFLSAVGQATQFNTPRKWVPESYITTWWLRVTPGAAPSVFEPDWTSLTRVLFPVRARLSPTEILAALAGFTCWVHSMNLKKVTLQTVLL